MSTPDDTEVSLIPAYVNARWGEAPDKALAGRLGSHISGPLKERIDLLGFDAEQLLNVNAEDVITELERLEKEADREDSRAEAKAARVREQEEVTIDGKNVQRRNTQMHTRRHQPPTGRGRHRQRGQR